MPRLFKLEFFAYIFIGSIYFMTSQLLLYGTVGCHLCDDAQALLQGFGNISIREIDIADDDVLLEQYGIRIPVLVRSDGAELGWPFGRTELSAFLDAD